MAYTRYRVKSSPRISFTYPHFDHMEDNTSSCEGAVNMSWRLELTSSHWSILRVEKSMYWFGCFWELYHLMESSMHVISMESVIECPKRKLRLGLVSYKPTLPAASPSRYRALAEIFNHPTLFELRVRHCNGAFYCDNLLYKYSSSERSASDAQL